MGRIASRVDQNQTEIVKAFRRMGYSVKSLAAVGDGMTDLLISKKGLNVLVEVKNGTKPPSEQRLRPKQEVFHSDWQGLRAIVNDVQGALDLANRLAAIKIHTDKCGLDSFLTGESTLDLR